MLARKGKQQRWSPALIALMACLVGVCADDAVAGLAALRAAPMDDE